MVPNAERIVHVSSLADRSEEIECPICHQVGRTIWAGRRQRATDHKALGSRIARGFGLLIASNFDQNLWPKYQAKRNAERKNTDIVHYCSCCGVRLGDWADIVQPGKLRNKAFLPAPYVLYRRVGDANPVPSPLGAPPAYHIGKGRNVIEDERLEDLPNRSMLFGGPSGPVKFHTYNEISTEACAKRHAPRYRVRIRFPLAYRAEAHSVPKTPHIVLTHIDPNGSQSTVGHAWCHRGGVALVRIQFRDRQPFDMGFPVDMPALAHWSGFYSPLGWCFWQADSRMAFHRNLVDAYGRVVAKVQRGPVSAGDHDILLQIHGSLRNEEEVVAQIVLTAFAGLAMKAEDDDRYANEWEEDVTRALSGATCEGRSGDGMF